MPRKNNFATAPKGPRNYNPTPFSRYPPALHPSLARLGLPPSFAEAIVVQAQNPHLRVQRPNPRPANPRPANRRAANPSPSKSSKTLSPARNKRGNKRGTKRKRDNSATRM